MASGGGSIEVLEVEPFGRRELLEALRGTRLSGFGGVKIYEDASLELVESDPGDLAPAQRYVLRPGVAKILALRKALLEHGVDVFSLDGGVFVRTADEPDQRIPVIPPIVEESHEPDGRTLWIINDGIHRVFAARSLKSSINTIQISGLPEEYPYYAFANPDGWREVTEFDELPDNFQKKSYRRPDGYKALFREFNDVFPGVQKERKDSNPGFLRA